MLALGLIKPKEKCKIKDRIKIEMLTGGPKKGVK